MWIRFEGARAADFALNRSRAADPPSWEFEISGKVIDAAEAESGLAASGSGGSQQQQQQQQPGG
jgi:hypothetical protein